MYTTTRNDHWTTTIFVFGYPVTYPFICEKAAKGFAEIMSYLGYEIEVSPTPA